MMSTSPVFFAAAGAHMCEELVSSCGSAHDPYKRSMERLLEYVGLRNYGTCLATVPPRTRAEADAIAAHIDAVKEMMARHQESVRRRNIRINKRKPTSALLDVLGSAAAAATAPLPSEGEEETRSDRTGDSGDETPTLRAPQQPTIYLSFEDSPEWKAFLTSVEPADRLAVTVRRRLTIELWRAHQRDICLYCWFPRNMCMCAQLDAYKAAMPARVLDRHVEVTMLLHSEELMRSTNSGHIAAYLLGAPIRVWGMDADDHYLRQLTPTDRRGLPGSATVGGAVAESEQHGCVTVFNVSLYPSAESIMIDDFIADKKLGLKLPAALGREGSSEHSASPQEASCGGNDGEGQAVQTPSTSAAEAHTPATTAEAPRKIHMILLDSTWGQALSLNRRLSRFIPRVRLDIPDTYDSLFQALRKRTRESGVSTLEATSMAIEQCVRAMGFREEAALATSTLTAAMKDFVDARCLLKYAEAQFTTDGGVLDDFRERRDDARRDDAARRQVVLAEKMQRDAEARRLRLPPVLNYCYCCDCVIGWHRVAEHVLGRSHRTALVHNPNCVPSAASRTVVVPDFSRPTRSERAAAAAAAASAVTDPES